MARKVVLWGMGEDYERLLNQIMFEIYKGNIIVEAVVCKKDDIFCSKRDGFQIVTKEDIHNIKFEYVLVTSSHHYIEIKNEAINEGVSEDRIIDASVFYLTFFDFERYANLIENPITIISDDCWGRFAYHQLKLPFFSPFINIDIDNKEYAKLLSDLNFFLNTELTMVREGNLREGTWPIARLGDDTRQVKLNLLHDVTFAEGKERWDRRKTRINPSNVFVKMRLSILDEDRAESISTFDSLHYKKILFYNGDEAINRKFITDRFIWRQNRLGQVENLIYSVYLMSAFRYDLDILRLLNGDETYSRYE